MSQRWSVPIDGDTAVSMDTLDGLDRFDVSDGDGVWVLALMSGGFPSFMTTITD